ncbi:alpha/beta-hydrolase [Microthyrium microscopicum]|uniref:Alpha/beta-hydrolase n=1 Tax=Microthyrium microscopicum TaxID=703497 RepID=A0A6A6UIV9_9PEZI|nr:alpha/beta-hydrolase [Microthyrium microscopicum]
MLFVFAQLLGLLAALASAQSLDDTAASNITCSPLELIIARGTNEPPAPKYGIIVGDPLFDATLALLPNITGYAVNYPADLSCESRPDGVNDTLNHLYAQSRACPSQAYVLVGYSQGADVMHFAAAKISPYLYNRIYALVMFGDPGNRGPNELSPQGGNTPPFPAALARKLKENCAPGDPLCNNNGTDVNAHLSYNDAGTTYISDSAKYIKKAYDAKGNQGPEPSPNGGTGEPTLAEEQAIQNLADLIGSGGTTCSTFPTVPASTATATGAPGSSFASGAAITPAPVVGKRVVWRPQNGL